MSAKAVLLATQLLLILAVGIALFFTTDPVNFFLLFIILIFLGAQNPA